MKTTPRCPVNGFQRGFVPLCFQSDRRRFWMSLASLLVIGLTGGAAHCQVNVLTSHNDIARDGQNTSETILNPRNVTASQFGKLFSQPISGRVFAQPLYASQIAIPGKGTHNVLYVAGLGDVVYAFDADTNGGANARPLWQASLLSNSTPAGTLTDHNGVWGTPVIDLPSQTMYLVSSENQGSASIFRLHALAITTGAEKFGGPYLIQASIPGTGSDSSGGVLNFDPTYQTQRSGLLLLNGILYIAFGSDNDEGPWHGWILSYTLNSSTQTMRQVDAFCTTPNGTGGGIWMGGEGLAAEVYNPAKPYGRMFFATGNGTFSQTAPYALGMSVVDLDLTGGVMTVEDLFSPYNEAALNSADADLGSGGPILLPTQTLASGATLNPLIEIGKTGLFYVLDRDNASDGSNNQANPYSPAGLGGFNSASDQIVQEVQTPITSANHWGAGVWGTSAYWNNYIYSGGITVAKGVYTGGTGSPLTAYSFVNGVMSSKPTSQSHELFIYPNATPSVSSKGVVNGIVWALSAVPQSNGTTALVLLAYDAKNLATTLYSSNTNLARDNPGNAAKYNVPTIANGKVYVAANSQVNVYGLLDAPTEVAPVISPAGGNISGSKQVTITDTDPNATIYYTTDGTTPTAYSTVYHSSTPIVVSSSLTVSAIASANGLLISPPATANFVSTTVPANPVLSLAAGTYIGPQTLTITDSSSQAVIYYTLDGSTPTSTSAVYSQALTISASETVNAVAINPNGNASSVVTAVYTIEPVGTIDFTNGFTLAQGPMTFNGSTDLDDFRLQLTNGGVNQAGSAFYATPVNIQAFNTTFTFQLSNPVADGLTFTIQNSAPTALGLDGGGLGYSKISNSAAIKFDLHNNNGEGSDSTGLYVNGASPTVPSIDLTGTGIDLHSGDYMNASLTYDGSTLTLTLTDAVTEATWSHSWAINLTGTIGSNTAYVGFTGGTGGGSSSQKVTSWFYEPQAVGDAPKFAAGKLTLNSKAHYQGPRLSLTDGHSNETTSAFVTTPVNIQAFTSTFEFQDTNAIGDGFTFTIQGVKPTALGGSGSGLGFQTLKRSVGLKFDIHNNSGEGSDSTGLYINGAVPTVPSIDLTQTAVNIPSGDAFIVKLTYDGTTITEVITDTITNGSVTKTYTVNIPSVVGGNTAYVGFTGATGNYTAIQEILNWSFTPTT